MFFRRFLSFRVAGLDCVAIGSHALQKSRRCGICFIQVTATGSTVHLARTSMTTMKIVIEAPNADFTPRGKRTFRMVTLSAMGNPVKRIRWYVSGRIFRTLPITATNMQLSEEWLGAGKRSRIGLSAAAQRHGEHR
jgi:hypothetical protein